MISWSPFAFGDWDGDGEDEAAVLYTADTTGSNVCLAVLEPSGEDQLAGQPHGGSVSEVENFNTANLKNAESQQLVGRLQQRPGRQLLRGVSI